MTEGQNDRKTDRLKTVYPPKLRLRGGIKKKKNITIFHLKIIIFSAVKNQSIYHRRVCIMAIQEVQCRWFKWSFFLFLESSDHSDEVLYIACFSVTFLYHFRN